MFSHSELAPKLDWFYTDSGHPGLDEYSSVILIHGMGWHGASFQRMFPLAGPAGLRFVALNRRGYPGTSPYTPEELEMLASDHGEFHRAQGLALALAMLRIVDDLALPTGKNKLAVLAWSAGTWFLLAMLSVVDDECLSADEKARLGALLSHAILIEPPSELMGNIPQVDAYTTLRNTVDPTELQRLATGYFNHPPGVLALRNVSRLNLATTLSVSSRSPLVDRLAPEELAEMTHKRGGTTVDGPLFSPAWLSTHEARAKTALQKVSSDAWPRLKQLYIVLGDRSFWLNYPGTWALQDYASEMGLPPPILKILPGGNHFMIVDHAIETTALVKDIFYISPET